MLDNIFLGLLNMSFTGGVVVLFVLALRALLSKAPKKYTYALWSVVLFRLVCPFSFESVLSLLPTNPTPITADIVYSPAPQLNTGIAQLDRVTAAILPPPTDIAASINPMQVVVAFGSLIWLVGIAIMLVYSFVSLAKLKKQLHGSTLIADNIYSTNSINTPFVVGLLHPKIYLPSGLAEGEMEYIILHEQTHIRRGDHLLKIVAFAVLCLHWFNPLAWLAFFLFGKDMEMACDEAVIGTLGAEVKKSYSRSLLSLATGRRIVGGVPLAFGEGNTKSRIKNVLNYKKPAVWVVGVAIVVVIIAAVTLLSNPINNPVNYGEDTANVNSTAPYIYRTEFVGDNSKVGGIINALHFPTGFTNNGFELQTTTESYSVNVRLKMNEEDFDYYAAVPDEARINVFNANGIRMLALIGNASEITFSLDGGIGRTHAFRVTRSYADSVLGFDVFEKTETEEGYAELEREIEKLFPITLNNDRYIAAQNAAITDAILLMNTTLFEPAKLDTAAHYTFASYSKGADDEPDGHTVYFARTMYMGFNIENGTLVPWGERENISAIAFDTPTFGEFTLTDYFDLKDGRFVPLTPNPTGFLPEMPTGADTGDNALSRSLTISCYEQAIAQGNIDIEPQIAQLIETITSSPSTASNPGAYITENQREYDTLVNYGNNTLKYFFAQFEMGGKTDLSGNIMAAVCQEILAIKTSGEDLPSGTFETGQDWYEAYKNKPGAKILYFTF